MESLSGRTKTCGHLDDVWCGTCVWVWGGVPVGGVLHGGLGGGGGGSVPTSHVK